MLVGGKVRGHKVEDHADAVAMQAVDEEHQILWRAVARGRRKEAGDPITPRSVKRVLHHRQQLDVGKA